MSSTDATMWEGGKYWMFNDLKTPRDVTAYTLFRGTSDWTQLQQFDLFQQGYPYLIMVSAPEFIKQMAKVDNGVQNLLNSYKHIIECEFLGFDSGLENIQAETQEISNGQQSINVITKTNAPSAMTFSMTYKELLLRCMSCIFVLYPILLPPSRLIMV